MLNLRGIRSKTAMERSKFTSVLIIGSFILISLISGCKDSRHVNVSALPFISISDTISLPLNEKTPGNPDYILSHSYEGKEVISFLDVYENNIYIYCNNVLLSTIRLSQYGIADNIQGYCFEGDSLFVYCYKTGMLSKIDLKAKQLLWSSPFFQVAMRDSITPKPYLTTATPLIKSQTHIIASGLVYGESFLDDHMTRPSVVTFDLDSKIVHSVLNYPKIYSKHSWGGGLLYRMPYISSTLDERIIVGFAACPQMYMLDIDCGTIQSFGCEQDAHWLPIPFRKKLRRNMNTPEYVLWEWYLHNLSYENILYDKYKNRIYRIVRLPVSKGTMSEENIKPTIIIVYDTDFNCLGKYSVPYRYKINPFHSIITARGLAVKEQSDDEDYLRFYLINLT